MFIIPVNNLIGIAGLIIFSAIFAVLGFILAIGLRKISSHDTTFTNSKPQKAIKQKKISVLWPLFASHHISDN